MDLLFPEFIDNGFECHFPPIQFDELDALDDLAAHIDSFVFELVDFGQDSSIELAHQYLQGNEHDNYCWRNQAKPAQPEDQ